MAIIGDAAALVTLKALIHVTTKPGATVAFKKGSTTMGTKTANSSGVAELEVLSGDWGAYTISCTWSQSGIGSTATGSGSVTLSEPRTYNVSVQLTWYLIQNGNFISGVGHSFVGSGAANFSDEGDYIRLHTYMGGSQEYASGYLTNAISMTDWKTMYIDSQEGGDSAYAGPANNTSDNPPTFSTYVAMCGQRKTLDSRHTSSLNISSITGNKYIAIRAKAWAAWDGGSAVGMGGDVRIWNLWLTS